MDRKIGKIVLCGTHEVGVDILINLLENNIPISHIVSLTDKQAKKYKVSGYCSYKKTYSECSYPKIRNKT